MRNLDSLILITTLVLPALSPCAAESVDTSAAVAAKTEESKILSFKPEQQASKGTVTVSGKRLDYDACAGTIVVHLKGYDDVPQNLNKDEKVGPAEASMFYAAYFKSGAPSAQRPITFLFNGGPGSSSVWLHMGAFGPRRVLTANDAHTPAAPYPLVNNEYSLLYEMRHLPISASLQKNIDFKFYESGHMVYAHEASLKALHENVADFIRHTGNVGGVQQP